MTYIVTVWNMGDVYMGNSQRKAEAAHEDALRSIRHERHFGKFYNGDFPVVTMRDGDVIRSSGGPKKYERQ